jgi:hypothetical protein
MLWRSRRYHGHWSGAHSVKPTSGPPNTCRPDEPSDFDSFDHDVDELIASFRPVP